MALGQGNVVQDLVKGVQDSVKGLLGGGGGGAADNQVETQQGTPPGYQPPLHGSDPHGQGTVGVADLDPTDERPLPANPEASSEDVIIGDSSGSQDANGDYHGRITLLKINLLDLLNFPALLEVETEEGQTESGPLDPLQEQVLNAVCAGLGQPIDPPCIEILRMDSSTTNTGSVNDFQTAGVNLPGVLTVGVASSHGEIQEDSNCQTATGTSEVANANLLGALPVTALSSQSQSTACNDGTQTTEAGSSALDIAGNPILGEPCGTPEDPGSAVPNTTILDLLPALFLGCAADDTNTNQTSAPYNVREAINAFILDLPLPGLFPIKVTTAGAESHAVAPGVTPPPPGVVTPPGDDGDDGRDRRDRRDDRGDDGGDDGPGGPAAGGAQAADEDLAFTGANMVWLALIGAMLIAGGLGLARASTRRSRRLTS